MPSSPARAETMITGTSRRARVVLQRRAAARSRRGWASSRRSATRSGGSRAGALERDRAVRRGLDRYSSGEQRRDVVAHVGVVVDDEHARRARRRPSARRRGLGRAPASAAPRPRSSPAQRSIGASAVARDLVGGRCSSPSGTRTVNAAARARASLSTSTEPPCSSASSATSARPMPVPSCVRERAPTTRWKRSNSRSWSAGAMPMPVSATVSSRRVAVGRRSAHRDRRPRT